MSMTTKKEIEKLARNELYLERLWPCKTFAAK